MGFKNESIIEKVFRDIPLFVEAARERSFTKAAEAMDIPLPTVSRRIAALEKTLGISLFHRKVRQVELTEYGQTLYERYRYIVIEAGAALEELLQAIKMPTGPVRFSVSAELYHTYMLGVIGDFAALWPGIRLHVQFSQRWVDLYSEPFDLDIRAGVLPDSDLKARKLLSLKPTLYASPKLLQYHPKPATPQDLRQFPCISLSQWRDAWRMSKGREQTTVTVNSVHTVDSLLLSMELALAGTGAAWLVAPVASPHVKSGELVALLPGWTLPGIELNAVMAGSQLPKRVRLFVDHLVAHFARFDEAAGSVRERV